MPIVVDHDQRRKDVSAAACVIVSEKGLDALTIRSVAATMECSTAVVSHYFSSKRDLLIAVYEYASARLIRRWTTIEAQGGSLMDCIASILPTCEPALQEWRVFFAYWAAASADPQLRRAQVKRVHQSRGRIRHSLQNDQRFAASDPRALDRAERAVQTAMLGVAIQAAFDPENWPQTEQIAAIEDALSLAFIPVH